MNKKNETAIIESIEHFEPSEQPFIKFLAEKLYKKYQKYSNKVLTDQDRYRYNKNSKLETK